MLSKLKTLLRSDGVMSVSPTKDVFCLQVNTSFNSLSEVLNWFETITTQRLSPELSFQCQLALSEGFTNAVSHAHKSLPETTPIDLKVSFFSDSLEIKIWDWGEPFDLETRLAQTRSEDCQSLDFEQGRGLILIKQAIDQIHYLRNEQGQNCLVLEKKLATQ